MPHTHTHTHTRAHAHAHSQVDPDDLNCAQTHSCRDFVDYDSNLIAVAHGIGTDAQSKVRVVAGRSVAWRGDCPR